MAGRDFKNVASGSYQENCFGGCDCGARCWFDNRPHGGRRGLLWRNLRAVYYIGAMLPRMRAECARLWLWSKLYLRNASLNGDDKDRDNDNLTYSLRRLCCCGIHLSCIGRYLLFPG